MTEDCSAPDIQIVGHVCVDLTPLIHDHPDTTPGVLTEVGAMHIDVGGAVGNGARVALGLGHSVALSATVGDDALGGMCRSALEAQNPGRVDLAASTTHATSYSVVVQAGVGDRSFWHHTGANDAFDGTCELMAAPVVHFGYPTLVPTMTLAEGQPTLELFRRAHQQGSLTSLDLAYCAKNSPLRSLDWARYFSKVLPETDVFCPSWDDVTSTMDVGDEPGPDMIPGVAAEFLALGAGVVLITAGELGCHISTGTPESVGTLALLMGVDAEGLAGVSEWIPASPVTNFVSTNGAGDTFKVAFLLSLRDAGDIGSAARRASAIVGRHISGQPLRVGHS